MTLTDRVRNARSSTPGTGVDVAKQKTATMRHVLDSMSGEFAKALPAHIPPALFIRTALTCVQKNPALLDCTAESFLGALMSCATLGLMPGTKEAALVPFGKTCTLIPQWQGMVKMMYNSGQVESVVAEFICEKDEWSYVPSLRQPADFFHRPSQDEDRGPVIRAYAFAWLLNGGRSRVSILTKSQAVDIRNRFSKNYARAEQNGRKNSTWHTDFDAMWRKSAIRRIWDYVPSSAEMHAFNSMSDDDGEITSTYASQEAPQQAVADAVPGELTPADQQLTEMLDLFAVYFPDEPWDGILGMLAEFTGRDITDTSMLDMADIGDIMDAFRTAEEGTESTDPAEVAVAFRELCAYAAAENGN